jgi:hypothetical protein
VRQSVGRRGPQDEPAAPTGAPAGTCGDRCAGRGHDSKDAIIAASLERRAQAVSAFLLPPPDTPDSPREPDAVCVPAGGGCPGPRVLRLPLCVDAGGAEGHRGIRPASWHCGTRPIRRRSSAPRRNAPVPFTRSLSPAGSPWSSTAPRPGPARVPTAWTGRRSAPPPRSSTRPARVGGHPAVIGRRFLGVGRSGRGPGFHGRNGTAARGPAFGCHGHVHGGHRRDVMLTLNSPR